MQCWLKQYVSVQVKVFPKHILYSLESIANFLLVIRKIYTKIFWGFKRGYETTLTTFQNMLCSAKKKLWQFLNFGFQSYTELSVILKLQSFTKYLRQILVIMEIAHPRPQSRERGWVIAYYGKSWTSVFKRFLLVLTKLSCHEKDWALGNNSMKSWDFFLIFLFSDQRFLLFFSTLTLL